jgi:hypothetical protein
MAHGQWTEIEARGILEALRRNGLGVEKFARSRGLVPQRVYWWKKELGIRTNRVPALVSVHVTEARTAKRANAHHRGEVCESDRLAVLDSPRTAFEEGWKER